MLEDLLLSLSLSLSLSLILYLQVDWVLEDLLPGRWIPLYTMVTFTRIPYVSLNPTLNPKP